jgi:MFS family permease
MHGVGSMLPKTRRDITLLFSTLILRLFAYGFLSVVLALYLAEAGLSEAKIGLLLSLTLAGDAVITLWLTTNADRFGRRRMLVAELFVRGLGVLIF